MKKRLFSVLKYLLVLGFGVFLVWWSLQQIPEDKWPEFKQSLANARYWIIIPVFVILFLSHLLRSLRWKILMQPLGYKPSTVNTFFAVMIGYLANLAVPRLGEVLKCTILARYEKVPADKLVGTIVAERAFDLISLILVFVVALILQYDIVTAYGMEVFGKIINDKSGNISFIKLGIIAFVGLAVIFSLYILFKKYGHLKFVMTVKNIITGVWQGLTSIRYLKNKWLFVFYSVGIWVMYAVGTWVGFYATQGTESLGLPPAVSGLAFASIGMIITPGGIGSYSYFLSEVMMQNGVAEELAIANSLLQWLTQFAIVLVLGFICMGLLPWYNKKRFSTANPPS